MPRFKKCCLSGPTIEMFETTTNPDPEEPIAATIICQTCGREFQGDMRLSDWGED